jgi:hypothetical protein
MVGKLFRSCFFLLSFLVVSCGYHEGVIQPAAKSFVVFVGNANGAVAVIDDAITVDIEKEIQNTGEAGKTVLFQLAPGRHKIIVKKAGTVVVDRIVIIADGSTKEIQIP